MKKTVLKMAKKARSLWPYLTTPEKRSSNSPYPSDFEEHSIDVIEKVKPYTMTSPERIVSLCNAVEYVVTHDIPGAFVECGGVPHFLYQGL